MISVETRAEAERMFRTAAQVLACVRRQGFLASPYVVAALGISKGSARYYLKALEMGGSVVGVGATRSKVWFSAEEWHRLQGRGV